MDNLIFAFLSGMLGGELANYVAKNDKRVELPTLLIYLISFSIVYTISVTFTGIVYLIKGFPIPWKWIGVFSISTSLALSLILFTIKLVRLKFKKQ